MGNNFLEFSKVGRKMVEKEKITFDEAFTILTSAWCVILPLLTLFLYYIYKTDASHIDHDKYNDYSLVALLIGIPLEIISITLLVCYKFDLIDSKKIIPWGLGIVDFFFFIYYFIAFINIQSCSYDNKTQKYVCRRFIKTFDAALIMFKWCTFFLIASLLATIIHLKINEFYNYFYSTSTSPT